MKLCRGFVSSLCGNLVRGRNLFWIFCGKYNVFHLDGIEYLLTWELPRELGDLCADLGHLNNSLMGCLGSQVFFLQILSG